MDNNNQVDLSELFRVLWSYKFLVISITTLFAVSSVFYALSLPNKYTSSSTLMISDSSGSDSLSGLSSQYGGLASLAGVNIPQSSSKNKSIYAMETIKSRDFVKHLVSFDDVLINIMAASNYDQSNKVIIYDEKILNYDKKEWVYKPAPGQQIPPSYLEAHKKLNEEILKIDIDEDTSYLTIEVNHVSPKFSYDLLSLIIKEINSTSRKKDQEESKMALSYLESQLVEIRQTDIINSINKLIESQLETLMLSNIRTDYLIEPLDAPFLPEIKSGPSRAIICIIFTIFGGILSIFLSIIHYYFIKNDEIK